MDGAKRPLRASPRFSRLKGRFIVLFQKRSYVAREAWGLWMFVLGLCLFPMMVYAQSPPAPGGVTPEKVLAAFQSLAPILMFAWGIVHTRWPAVAHWPNDLVPWINAVGYIVGAFVVGQVAPPANAAPGVVHALTGFAWLVYHTAVGGAMSAVTSVLYDKFAKAGLDAAWPQAVPGH